MSDMEGKVTRVGASERGQRTSFKIVCCNFCKGLFLKAGWRWVDRNYGNGANGMNDIEGKVTRVGASERGQRTSFNAANGMSDMASGQGSRLGRSV